MHYKKKTASIKGHIMAYVDEGEGDPIVFLHGNPSSSDLWRDIIPHMDDRGRSIAPDLIGMGDSAKLPGEGDDRYRFVEHRAYLDALLDHLGVSDNVIFVIHDWGSALGFDWIRRHPESVAGVAYMESIVQPFSWDTIVAAEVFQAWRSPAGEELILEKNMFVEEIVPAGIMRTLTEEELAEYHRPYLTPGEDRRPTLTWPREVPIDGEPADVHNIVEEYSSFIAESDIPKLFINAEPGFALVGANRNFARSWKNQTEVTVEGVHFIQEDAPDKIVRHFQPGLRASRKVGVNGLTHNTGVPWPENGSSCGPTPTAKARWTCEPFCTSVTAHMNTGTQDQRHALFDRRAIQIGEWNNQPRRFRLHREQRITGNI